MAEAHIGQITLNRPENRNSMDPEVMPAFLEVIERAKADRDLRCLIVTGSGQSFCTGADFRSRSEAEADEMPHERSYRVYDPFLRLHDIRVPTIAAMNGHAIGGGFGLALICDLRIADKGSKYGANFARLGLHTGMSVSYMLPRIVGLPLANELLFTGRLINGVEAARIGLVNCVTEQSEVIEKAWSLAREIASCAPVAVRMIKRSIHKGLEWDPRLAAELEAHCQSRTIETEDAREGIAALLEKREPVFKGR